MAETATLARPYARAAFEYAQQQQGLAAWSEFLAAASAVVADGRVAPLIGNPNVDGEQLADLVMDVAGRGAGENAHSFLRVLADNDRMQLLPEIASQFEQLRAEVENTVDVTITSAIELTAEQRDKFAASLAKRFGRKVRLHCEVDPRLIGGAVVRAGDFVIDGSLHGKLERLRSAMGA
jgi:F-type H+-transporting ATPase subunit delta